MKCSLPYINRGLHEEPFSCADIWANLCSSRVAFMFPVWSVVGKHSPFPCRYRAHVLSECSWGHDPFCGDLSSRQHHVFIAVLFSHSQGSFLMHLSPRPRPGPETQTNLFGQMNPIDLAHLKGCGSSPGGSSLASPQELRAADLDHSHPHLKHGNGGGVVVAECITVHIKPSCATLGQSDLAAVCVLVAVSSLINKWVATVAQDVTHSREAVLSPLMTINVSRTISAHPLKCLTVDGLVPDRSAILIWRSIQTQTDWLTSSLTEVFSPFSLRLCQHRRL